jgi:hypothetical protein
MADGNGAGASTFLAFIVGGLLVFVALVFVFGWSGGDEKTVKLELPQFDRTK